MPKNLKSLSFFAVILLLTACGHFAKKQENAAKPGEYYPPDSTGKLTSIHFDSIAHDFGTLHEGEVVAYSYRFTNTGKNDLVISQVFASCGCTVTDYPKIAIAPGESNLVSIKFYTEGKRGFQAKNITVITNTRPVETQLRFTAKVLEPNKKDN